MTNADRGARAAHKVYGRQRQLKRRGVLFLAGIHTGTPGDGDGATTRGADGAVNGEEAR